MANRDHSLDDEIIQAAYSEFLPYGFQKASLHKIAEKAGVIGKRADLVILSEDPLRAGKDRIRGITVLETIKDGETVYCRER